MNYIGVLASNHTQIYRSQRLLMRYLLSYILYLSEENAVKELVGLLLVLGDVSIGMHAEDLGMGDDG